MSGSAPSPVAAAPSPVAGAVKPSGVKRALMGATVLAGFGAVLWLTSGGPPTDKEKEPPAPVETAGQIGAPYEGTPRPRAQQTGQRTTETTTATETKSQGRTCCTVGCRRRIAGIVRWRGQWRERQEASRQSRSASCSCERRQFRPRNLIRQRRA